MDAAAVRDRANELPAEPGVYQFTQDGTVRYIGKALDLRDRVRNYADPRGERIRRMVRRADAIDVAVTDTETQALLLEANLIKRHQPRYNVRLKDDKSYPMVQLTDHPVPRIEITRDPAESATVWGPFTDVGRTESVIKALREVYGVRGCSDHKYASRERPCLDFDLGLCTAPCTGEITTAEYADDVEQVHRFFDGETGVLSDPLRSMMEAAADNHEYERAANLRDRLRAVESFHGGAGDTVSAPDDRAVVDVLGVAVEGDRAVVARLHAEGGKLVERDRHVLAAPGADEPAGSVLAAFIPQYYAERRLPDAIVCSAHLEDREVEAWLATEGVEVRVPGAGREARLVDLALKNARQYTDEDEIGALAEALDLPRPERIEGFDVSHAHGGNVVGSNVVFVGGRPEKAHYRRKKLDEQNDDYANMAALVAWRAERALAGRDDRPDPDLLVIDGGAGQLDAAQTALQGAGWDIPAIGLAKAEELVVTERRTYDWPSDAPQLHLVQRVRDEAHRFAVQYHQLLRDEVSTVLDDIPGVGPTRRRALLRHFGSIEGIRQASVDEIASVPGVGAGTAETIATRL